MISGLTTFYWMMISYGLAPARDRFSAVISQPQLFVQWIFTFKKDSNSLKNLPSFLFHHYSISLPHLKHIPRNQDLQSLIGWRCISYPSLGNNTLRQCNTLKERYLFLVCYNRPYLCPPSQCIWWKPHSDDTRMWGVWKLLCHSDFTCQDWCPCERSWMETCPFHRWGHRKVPFCKPASAPSSDIRSARAFILDLCSLKAERKKFLFL